MSAPLRREVPIEQVAGSVTVIERSEIERRQLRTLPDVLREVPGIHVAQSGGIGKTTSIFTRGTESNHTLILLDGIEISDPSQPGGVFDTADLLTDDLERVEVVRGPFSTAYGSDAIGGVINLVTKRGRGATQTWGRLEAGAFNTFQQSLGITGGDESVDYSVSFTNLHSRGITAFDEELGGHERDGYDNRTLSARLGSSVADIARFDLIGRFVDLENELDIFADNRQSRGSNRQLFLRAQGELDLFDGRWMPRFAVSYSDHDRKISNPPSTTTFDGRRLKLELLNDFALLPNQVTTIGAETERETVDLFAFSGPSDGRVRTSAVFAQHSARFLDDRVVGSVGGRLEHHDEFGTQLTYRMAGAYVHPRSGTRLHATLATGFKAPSLSDELFDPLFGNEDLDPEKSRGWEVGVEQPLGDGRVRIGTTYFQNRTRNLITFVNVNGDPNRFQARNVQRSKADGFETFIDFRLERVRVRIDHTYTMAEDRDLREDLLRRPSHQVQGRVELRPIDWLTLTTSIQYVGQRKDVDAVTFDRTSIGGYTVARMTTEVELRPGLALFGRLENVFDKDYRDPDGFENPGFAGFAGIRVAF